MFRKITLSFQGRHTARAGGGDGLAVDLVLHVAAGKDTFDAGFGGAGDGLDVADIVEIKLALKESGVGLVPNSVKKPAGGYCFFIIGFDMADLNAGYHLVPQNFHQDSSRGSSKVLNISSLPSLV